MEDCINKCRSCNIYYTNRDCPSCELIGMVAKLEIRIEDLERNKGEL